MLPIVDCRLPIDSKVRRTLVCRALELEILVEFRFVVGANDKLKFVGHSENRQSAIANRQ